MLDYHNLLKSRSPLAKRSASIIGRLDYVHDKDGRWRGQETASYLRKSTRDPSGRIDTHKYSYTERLTQRLTEKTDRYFSLGQSYFREKQYLKSQQYFELVRQLEDQQPRAYVAIVIVSFQRNDINTAAMSLVRALNRAHGLRDLEIDRRAFYPSDPDFQQILDVANLIAKSNEDSSKANILLAFYSWLNEDWNTAIEAAQSSSRSLNAQLDAQAEELSLSPREERIDPAWQFAELLIEARDHALNNMQSDPADTESNGGKNGTHQTNHR